MQDTSRTCSYCGTSNESEAHFCRVCGHLLPLYYRCIHCKHESKLLPVRFCGHCGKKSPEIDQNSNLLLLPFLDGDKIGYIDYHTDLVYIPPKYYDGRLFSEGLAAVRMNESSKWVFINEWGDKVIDGEYNDCSEFSNGLAIIQTYSPTSDEPDGPVGTIGHPQKKIRLFGVINTSGDEVIPCEYTSIERRADGCFYARKEKKEYLFDRNCNPLFESEYYSVCGLIDSVDGLFKIYQKDTHLYGLLDLCGNFVMDPKYDEMKSFSEGLCPVCLYVDGQKKWGFINTDGQECIPCQFQEIDDFHDGVATYRFRTDIKEFVFPDGKHIHPYGYLADGLINTLGETVIEPMAYYSLYSSREGLLECRDFNDLIGFLNSKGEVVIPCKYKEASKFVNGLSVVESPEGKCGMIDKNGNTIIPFEYDPCRLYYDRDNHIRTKDNLFVLKKDGGFGVIDIDCNTIIPHQYDSIDITGEGSFLVKQGELVGLMNHQGDFVIPLGMYDRIDKIYTPLPLELYRVYKGHDLSGIVDAKGAFRVPCQFFWINNGHVGSTELFGNPFKLDHRPDCILEVRQFDENRKAIRGKADFFGNYRLRKD